MRGEKKIAILFTSHFRFLFQTIKDVDLQALGSLEYINLSRNLIREIMPGTFLGMANLKGLDFSVNVVRKVRHFLLITLNFLVVASLSSCQKAINFFFFFETT